MSQLKRYIASPSAKKCCVKGRNCYFCDVDAQGSDMLLHPLYKTIGRDLYARFFRTRQIGINSVNSIVVKLYDYISCQKACLIHMKTHLQRNMDYLEYYREKLGVINTHMITIPMFPQCHHRKDASEVCH